MTTMALPTTFEAVTPEWLTRALQTGGKAGDATVRSVSFGPVGQGVGILCQVARLTLEYDGDAGQAPRTLVAKIPSTDPQTRGMVSVFGFYEREVRMYRELGEQIPIRTPRCYYGEFDPASGDFVLLLEDLAHLRLGDQLECCPVDDVKLIIREIAKLHTDWWNKPALNQLSWVPTTDDPRTKAGVALYPHAWTSFMERLGHTLPEEMRRTGEKLGGSVVGILDRFVNGPQTLLHADLRLDNIFFGVRPEDPPLTLIDWQISARGVGTYDVGYLMSQSMDIDVRRQHEQELLRMYHGLLQEGGVTDYSFDQMLDDYRWTVLFCFAYPVMGGGLGDLSNERGYALARAMMERSAAAIMDWDAGKLLEG